MTVTREDAVKAVIRARYERWGYLKTLGDEGFEGFSKGQMGTGIEADIVVVDGLYAEDIKRTLASVGKDVEELIKLASQSASEATIDGLRQKGFLVNEELMTVAKVAQKIVQTYRMEAVGHKPQTVAELPSLLEAVDYYMASLR